MQKEKKIERIRKKKKIALIFTLNDKTFEANSCKYRSDIVSCKNKRNKKKAYLCP
jgi:hypothetical protein